MTSPAKEPTKDPISMNDVVVKLFWGMGAVIALWVGNTINNHSASNEKLAASINDLKVQISVYAGKTERTEKDLERLNLAFREHVQECPTLQARNRSDK